MKRKKFTPDQRREIYDKCNGHCAYCGVELAYKDMQVDHVKPFEIYEDDSMDNLLPACRSCNHYKSSFLLYMFRRQIEDWPNVLARNNVTYRNAVRYGLVEPRPRKVKFYFEMMEGGAKE
jgi:5-methylcytosine-specific restriction endonuclease McrA